MSSQDGSLDEILQKLAELEPTINTLKKLQESGLMSVLDAIAEQSDNLFNYASTMELLGAASALLKIIPVMSQVAGMVDAEDLQEKLDHIPWKALINLFTAFLDFVGSDLMSIEPPEGKGKTLKLLSEVRSPEMEYLLRIMRALSTRMMAELKKQRKM